MQNKYGEWEIEKPIGEGGQAHIYLAKNKNGEKGVIKRLKNLKRIDRFIKETDVIKAAPQNLFPGVIEINLEAEKPYFVMEYFPKGGLREELIKDWTLIEKCDFFIGVMVAIAYANQQGVVHRDLKPANILVDEDGRAKVTDFGICFIAEDGTRGTLTEEAAGSFKYMAPELEDGRSDLIGSHTDVYSLGKIAYWLFSGGRIYNRERHREDAFDLTKTIKEHWVHYFYDFLDGATQHDISARIKDCPNLIVEFGKVREAIAKEMRYLDLKLSQACNFCSNGNYKSVVDSINTSAMNVHNFGFNPVGQAKWLILVCDNCGNVQSFRADYCDNWAWKKE